MTLEPNDGWILTASGMKFDLFNPHPKMVTIGDIAHALAHVCRFGGHTSDLYTVAQHSVIVSHNVPAADQLVGLMHDATEAYCGDMVRPLKRQLPAYKTVEDRIWGVIQDRFNLGAITAAVKEADERCLQTERRDVLIQSSHAWLSDEQRAAPFPEIITPWPTHFARTMFLRRFTELQGAALEAAYRAPRAQYGHGPGLLDIIKRGPAA